MSPDNIAPLAIEALVLTLQLSAPLVGAAAGVGLLLGFLQAITQLQDQTTTFAFKLAVVFGLLLALMPWLGAQLSTYGERIFTLVAQART